jgi:hypothetical protein
LFTFGSDIRQLSPMQSAERIAPIDKIVTNGRSAVNDAVVAAMVYRPAPAPDRRHLVLVFTDGKDDMSVVPAERLQAVAREAEAVLSVVFPPFRPVSMLPLSPVDAVPEDSRNALTLAAELSGGRAYATGLFGDDLPSAFARVLDDFRTSYVLTYRPMGVDVGGWHSVGVSVKQAGKINVRARSGYFVRPR